MLLQRLPPRAAHCCPGNVNTVDRASLPLQRSTFWGRGSGAACWMGAVIGASGELSVGHGAIVPGDGQGPGALSGAPFTMSLSNSRAIASAVDPWISADLDPTAAGVGAFRLPVTRSDQSFVRNDQAGRRAEITKPEQK